MKSKKGTSQYNTKSPTGSSNINKETESSKKKQVESSKVISFNEKRQKTPVLTRKSMIRDKVSSRRQESQELLDFDINLLLGIIEDGANSPRRSFKTTGGSIAIKILTERKYPREKLHRFSLKEFLVDLVTKGSKTYEKYLEDVKNIITGEGLRLSDAEVNSIAKRHIKRLSENLYNITSNINVSMPKGGQKVSCKASLYLDPYFAIKHSGTSVILERLGTRLQTLVENAKTIVGIIAESKSYFKYSAGLMQKRRSKIESDVREAVKAELSLKLARSLGKNREELQLLEEATEIKTQDLKFNVEKTVNNLTYNLGVADRAANMALDPVDFGTTTEEKLEVVKLLMRDEPLLSIAKHFKMNPVGTPMSPNKFATQQIESIKRNIKTKTSYFGSDNVGAGKTESINAIKNTFDKRHEHKVNQLIDISENLQLAEEMAGDDFFVKLNQYSTIKEISEAIELIKKPKNSNTNDPGNNLGTYAVVVDEVDLILLNIEKEKERIQTRKQNLRDRIKSETNASSIKELNAKIEKLDQQLADIEPDGVSLIDCLEAEAEKNGVTFMSFSATPSPRNCVIKCSRKLELLKAELGKSGLLQNKSSFLSKIRHMEPVQGIVERMYGVQYVGLNKEGLRSDIAVIKDQIKIIKQIRQEAETVEESKVATVANELCNYLKGLKNAAKDALGGIDAKVLNTNNIIGGIKDKNDLIPFLMLEEMRERDRDDGIQPRLVYPEERYCAMQYVTTESINAILENMQHFQTLLERRFLALSDSVSTSPITPSVCLVLRTNGQEKRFEATVLTTAHNPPGKQQQLLIKELKHDKDKILQRNCIVLSDNPRDDLAADIFGAVDFVVDSPDPRERQRRGRDRTKGKAKSIYTTLSELDKLRKNIIIDLEKINGINNLEKETVLEYSTQIEEDIEPQDIYERNSNSDVPRNNSVSMNYIRYGHKPSKQRKLEQERLEKNRLYQGIQIGKKPIAISKDSPRYNLSTIGGIFPTQHKASGLDKGQKGDWTKRETITLHREIAKNVDLGTLIKRSGDMVSASKEQTNKEKQDKEYCERIAKEFTKVDNQGGCLIKLNNDSSVYISKKLRDSIILKTTDSEVEYGRTIGSIILSTIEYLQKTCSKEAHDYLVRKRGDGDIEKQDIPGPDDIVEIVMRVAKDMGGFSRKEGGISESVRKREIFTNIEGGVILRKACEMFSTSFQKMCQEYGILSPKDRQTGLGTKDAAGLYKTSNESKQRVDKIINDSKIRASNYQTTLRI